MFAVFFVTIAEGSRQIRIIQIHVGTLEDGMLSMRGLAISRTFSPAMIFSA